MRLLHCRRLRAVNKKLIIKKLVALLLLDLLRSVSAATTTNKIQQISLAMLSLHFILNFFAFAALTEMIIILLFFVADIVVQFVVNIIYVVVVVAPPGYQLHKLAVGIPKTTRLNKLLAVEAIYAFLLST